MNTLGIYIGRDEVIIENPTPNQLRENILALDGETRSGLGLRTANGFIGMHGSQHERVRFFYRLKGDRFQNELRDIKHSDIPAMVITLHNGEVDYIPADETISRERAIETAVYFLEHGIFPEVHTEPMQTPIRE